MGYMHSWSMVNRTMDEPDFSWFMGPVIGLILVALWLWLLVDCARRDFRNNVEKALWVLILMLAPLVGAVTYLVVIKYNNPTGLLNPDWRGPSPAPTSRPVPMPPQPVAPQTPPSPPTPPTPPAPPIPPTPPAPPANPPQQNQ